jgi:type II secretory pathway component GspD/PulD (secretin)
MTSRKFGWAVCALALAIAAPPALLGQDKARPEPARDGDSAKEKRLLYVVRNGSAKDLAAVLSKHFKAAADIQALPDGPSNCLLISAAPAVLDEAVKALAELDRRPALIAVEVIVVEVTPKKNSDGKLEPSDKDLDEKEFTGPTADVLARVEAMQKKGHVGEVRRVQLTTLENQPASALAGENRPFVRGVTVTGGGKVARSVTFHQLGDQVKVTPRVGPEKRVLLDLNVNHSGARIPEDGIELGKDENGVAIRMAEFVTATLEAQTAVAAGQAVAVKGVKTTSKSGQAQTLVLATARVVEGDEKPRK